MEGQEQEKSAKMIIVLLTNCIAQFSSEIIMQIVFLLLSLGLIMLY